MNNLVKGAIVTGTIVVGGMEVEAQNALYADVLQSQNLPNFLIQDPINGRNYWLKSDILKDKYLCNESVMDNINENTAVFALPDGNQIPYKPAMTSSTTADAAVIIWHVAANKVYHIPHNELNKYVIQGQPNDEGWGGGKAYVLCMPIMYSKIKELPVLMQGLLQHFHEDNHAIARYKGRIFDPNTGIIDPAKNSFDPAN